MHYLGGRPGNDTSGIRLHLTDQAVPYSAGMMAFAAAFSIPPKTRSTLVPNSCCYSGWEPLHGFATRVHTHALGRWVGGLLGVCADTASIGSRMAEGQIPHVLEGVMVVWGRCLALYPH